MKVFILVDKLRVAGPSLVGAMPRCGAWWPPQCPASRPWSPSSSPRNCRTSTDTIRYSSSWLQKWKKTATAISERTLIKIHRNFPTAVVSVETHRRSIKPIADGIFLRITGKNTRIFSLLFCGNPRNHCPQNSDVAPYA